MMALCDIVLIGGGRREGEIMSLRDDKFETGVSLAAQTNEITSCVIKS